MLEIGSVLDGKYKILSEIGHGGMSVVYMALNEKANKTWAVKEIRKDGKMDFNTVRQGLVAEIETLKRLKHPNLPSVIDVIEDDDTFIIVMDYIEGNSLDKALKEYGAQPQENVIEWAKQLCDVLGYLHSENPPIIYRDMKPANIMLKPDGNIALIDFGTAKTYEIDLGETTGIGTIGYAAPEQYRGSGWGRTDARTDIYCLGITLYHLLTGVDPCEEVIDDYSIRAVNPTLSPGLDEIIVKCTRQQPNDRYQSCAELLYAIEHHNEMGDAYRKKQKKKLASFISTVSASVLCAIVAVASFFMAENKKEENYGVYLENAGNPEMGWVERKDEYIKAIEIDPTRTEAYLGLIDLFLSTEEEKGSFSTSEAAVIVQLKAGLDIGQTSGYTTTSKPFEELKNSNPEGYQDVCNEIGFAYWYDYELEAVRYSQASEWFGESVEKYPLAGIFCEIGECHTEIQKYEDQKRTEKMYSAYKSLWEKLTDLYKAALENDDNDIKLLILEEIVSNISEKAAYFMVNTSQTDITALLNNVSTQAQQLGERTQFQDIRDIAEELVEKTEIAKARVSAVANS